MSPEELTAGFRELVAAVFSQSANERRSAIRRTVFWSSRATELAEVFPGHVAAAFRGHSTQTAQKHYWQVTDEHFALAAG